MVLFRLCIQVFLLWFQQAFVLRLIYNMGSGIKILQESNVDISDGMFHVVRVIRNNAFMQLQVDSEDILEATSDGTQSIYTRIHSIKWEA